MDINASAILLCEAFILQTLSIRPDISFATTTGHIISYRHANQNWLTQDLQIDYIHTKDPTDCYLFFVRGGTPPGDFAKVRLHCFLASIAGSVARGEEQR